MCLFCKFNKTILFFVQIRCFFEVGDYGLSRRRVLSIALKVDSNAIIFGLIIDTKLLKFCKTRQYKSLFLMNT